MAKSWIRFKGQFKIPKLEMQTWLRENEQRQTDTLEKAVMAWLTASVAIVPHWSGASLGTFSKLAARVNFALSIPGPVNKLAATKGLGEAAGAAASTGTFGEEKKGKFVARYTTNLAHLIVNEYTHATRKTDPNIFAQLKTDTPYHFQRAAKAVAEPIISRAQLPRPKIKIGSKITVK